MSFVEKRDSVTKTGFATPIVQEEKMDSRINSAIWTLRIAFGLTAFLAGLDKYFNLLTNWEKYVSPLSPLPAATPWFVAAA